MICMIADYIEGGADKHRAYIAKGTADEETAINALLASIAKTGGIVRRVAVIPGTYSMKELEKIAERPREGIAAIAYIFENGQMENL